MVRAAICLALLQVLAACGSGTSENGESAAGRMADEQAGDAAGAEEQTEGEVDVSSAALPAPLESPDPSPQEPTAAWFAGIWLHDATRADLARLGCNSSMAMRYDADGGWTFFEGHGRWSLADGMLTSTILKMWETSYPDEENAIEIGKPFSLPIRRIGPHEGALFSVGKWRRMLRCRPGDLMR